MAKTTSNDHQEFSFPSITDSCSCTIDSPPLWHLSPAASPPPHHVKSHREEGRKSWGKMVLKRSEEDEKEKKMDMLWEDFNEELLSGKASSPLDSSRLMDSSSVGCIQQLQALRLPKTRHNKPGFGMLIGVLKKVFFIHSPLVNTPHEIPIKYTSRRRY